MIRSQRKHTLEKMEDRHMMSSIGLFDGELQIEGSEMDDQVTVSQRWGYYRDAGAGPKGFAWGYGSHLRVQLINDSERITKSFAYSSVDEIDASLAGGDDTFTNNTNLDSEVRAGAGDDLLRGGSARDTFFGQNGNDTLYGRAGNDVLFGGSHNDGLFGGEGYDEIVGNGGADRFLYDTQSYDRFFDVGTSDALIYFEPGRLYDQNPVYKQDFVFHPGEWTDSEIELVDSALKELHEATGDDDLLEKANGRSMRFLRHSDVTNSAGKSLINFASDEDGFRFIDPQTGEWALEGGTPGGFNDNGIISLNDSIFLRGDDMVRQSVLHEVGHNWDLTGHHGNVVQRNNLLSFRAQSGWDYQSKGESVQADQTAAADGQGEWAFTTNSQFVRPSYGTFNPREDFATTFAAYFMGSDYYMDSEDYRSFADRGVEKDPRSLAPGKFAALDRMFEFWRL